MGNLADKQFEQAAEGQQPQNQKSGIKVVVIGTGGTAKATVHMLVNKSNAQGSPLVREIVFVGRNQENLDTVDRKGIAGAPRRNIKITGAIDANTAPADDGTCKEIYSGADVVIQTSGFARKERSTINKDELMAIGNAEPEALYVAIETANANENALSIKDLLNISTHLTPEALRKPEQKITREQLLEKNVPIVGHYAHRIRDYCDKDTKVVVLANPLDSMTELMIRETGLPEQNIAGMGSELDTDRGYFHLAKETGIEKHRFAGLKVIGQHGVNMVPCFDALTLDGEPISTKILTPEVMKAVEKGVIAEGGKVLELEGRTATGGPGLIVADMVSAFTQEEPTKLLASVRPNGCYGLNDESTIGLDTLISSRGAFAIEESISPENKQKLFKAYEKTCALNEGLPAVEEGKAVRANVSATTEQNKDGPGFAGNA